MDDTSNPKIQLPIVVRKTTDLVRTSDDVGAGIIRSIERHMSDQTGVLEKAEQITRDVEAEIRIADTVQYVDEDGKKTISYVREVRIAKDGKK